MLRKKNKPNFLRQEWFREIKLEKKWRRPKGKHSKLRRHKKGKGFLPTPGYRTPMIIRGLHPSGAREVLISNIKQLESIDPRKECARLSAKLGRKKRIEIKKICDRRMIKILNPQRTEALEKVKK